MRSEKLVERRGLFLVIAFLLAAPASAEQIKLDAKAHPDFLSLRQEGCISEDDFFFTVHQEADKAADGGGNKFSWDTSNVGDGWILRYTVGTAVDLIFELFKQPVLQLDSGHFPNIANACKDAKSTRELALCLQEKTHAYMKEHDLYPAKIMGGRGAKCKLYATYAYGAADHLPPIVAKQTVVSGWGHVINKIAVLDDKGQRHVYMLDPLNLPVFAKLTSDDGTCLKDAPIGDPAKFKAEPKKRPSGRKERETLVLNQLKSRITQ